MKIAIYFADDIDKPTGSRNRILSLANALGRKHEVFVIAPSIMSRDQASYTPIILKHPRKFRQISKFLNITKAFSEIRKIRPDIIYSFLDISLPTMIPTAKLLRIPHGVEIHDRSVEDICMKYHWFKQNGLMYKLLDRCTKWLIKMTDFQVLGNNTHRAYYKEYLTRWCIVPPSIDLALFNEKVDPDKKLCELKKKLGKIIVMYAGNYNYYQGVDMLLSVIKELREKSIHDFHFVLVGSTPNEIGERIRSMGIKECITLLGQVPNEKVATVLRAADILIIPRVSSKRTSTAFPAKPLEYMAVGGCVVSTNNWPCTELIEDGKNGQIIYPPYKENFIKALLGAKDAEKRRTWGKSAAKTIKKKFNIEHDVIMLTKLFEEIRAKKW